MSAAGAEALQRGTALLQAGDAASALPLLRVAMDALPAEPRAAFRTGAAAFALGDYALAADGFQAATARDPGWIEAWSNLGAALARLGRHDEAIDVARRALKLDPQRVASWQALAALLSNRFDKESLEEGLRAVALVLRADPDSAQAHHVAGLLWRKHGDRARAVQHARRAVALAPADAELVEALGEALLVAGEAEAAADAYAQAMSQGVRSAAIERQHGIALLQAGRVADATQVLARALRAEPQDQRTIAHLGAALGAAGDTAAAERLLGLQRNVHAVRLAPPEGFHDADSFHAALARDIRGHSRQRWEPAGLAAHQAYLSGDLLADRTPAIQGFEQRLRQAIDGFIAGCHADPEDAFLRNVPRDYRLHVWATLAAQAGYIGTHIHEESWLSGAYYVELPGAVDQADADRAGWIEFGRPFPNLPPVPDALLRTLQPRVGTLLLFPSFLFHRTLPYTGAGERISISFDLAAA